jgi:hypothetical protein
MTRAVVAVAHLASTHHTIREVLEMECSDVTVEECYEVQNFFFRCK